MFCPLCKAEYRDGPEQCSDCVINLVQNRHDAEALRVVVLWEGDLARFNAIVGALLDARIPNHAEGRNPITAKGLPPWWAFMGHLGYIIYKFRKGSRKDKSWRVSVLESDYTAAKVIVDKLP
jgi:hypothetical protein